MPEPDFSRTLAIYSVLLVFGIVYNSIIAWVESKHPAWAEALTWAEVVIGVTVTLIAIAPVIGWCHTQIVFLAFSASGLPMSIGAVVRFAKKVQAYLRRLKNEQQTPSSRP